MPPHITIIVACNDAILIEAYEENSSFARFVLWRPVFQSALPRGTQVASAGAGGNPAPSAWHGRVGRSVTLLRRHVGFREEQGWQLSEWTMTVRQRVKRLVWLLAVVVVVGWPVAAHYRAKARVRQYVRQLQASGEKLTVGELTALASPESYQRASALFAAAQQLNTGSLTDAPPTMRYVAPGRALVAWRQPVLPTSESPDVWPGLSRAMERRAEALAAVREALAGGPIVFNLDYSQGYDLLLPHLAPIKGASRWLSAATILALHEGQAAEAFDNLEALTALVAQYRDEPVMISELVRIAIGQIALNATWEALQWPEWQDGQLEALQSAWVSVDLLTQAEAVLAMERLTCQQTFAKARESFTSVSSMLGNAPSSQGLNELAEFGKHLLEDPKDTLKAVSQRYPQYWAWRYWRSYEDELLSLKTTQAALEAVRRARTERALGPALRQLEACSRQLRQAHPRAGSWMDITSVLSGGADRFLGRVSVLERQRSVLIAALALQRYHLKQGVYPSDLTAMVPDFASATPPDFITGQPLHYRLETDGTFRLYSNGENDIDDGGVPDFVATPTRPQSIGAKQWWRGRDAVWPLPATTDQVRAYLEEVDSKRVSITGPAAAPLGEAAAQAFARRYGLRPPSGNSATNPPAGTN